jgi:phosphoglycerate dehydrogenase-like enzyme
LGPEAAAVFTDTPNLLLTPHVAGNAREAVERVATMIVEAVLEDLDR